MVAKMFLLLIGLMMWVVSLMAQEPRTRPRPERLIESNAPGEFIIADDGNDGQWNPFLVFNDTVLTINGDTVVVFPIPGVTPQLLSIDSTGAAAPRTFTITISDGNSISFQDLGGAGSFTFDFTGDTGTQETITDTEVMNILGGVNVNTVSSTPNTLTINVPTLDDADPDPTNEIQTIDSFLIVNDSLLITLSDDGVSPLLVDLSPYLDNTDNQTISWNPAIRFLTISGGNSEFIDVMQNWVMTGDLGVDQTVTHAEEADFQGGLGLITTIGGINTVSMGYEFLELFQERPTNITLDLLIYRDQDSSTYNSVSFQDMIMVGATPTVDGEYGFVTTPVAGQDTMVLFGDGMWKSINQAVSGDNWGSQVVESDVSLNGTGILGDLLSVDVETAQDLMGSTIFGSTEIGVVYADGPGTITVSYIGTRIQSFNFGDGSTTIGVNDGNTIHVGGGVAINTTLAGGTVSVDLDIDKQSEDLVPLATDFLIFYDVDAATHDKVQIGNLPVGGSSTFLGLTDTEDDYIGHANQFVSVNVGEDGLIFQNIAVGMSSWNLDGDTGVAETVGDAETVLILGGTNVNTVVSTTNTITVNVPSLDDADASPTNEVQDLSWNQSNGNLGVTLGGAGVTILPMVGATPTVDGEMGFVTKPVAGQDTMVLFGDGMWKAINQAVQGDNWGSQVVQSDVTLDGTGVLGDLLSVNQENIEDWIDGLLVGGTDIGLVYDDVGGTLTINFTGSGGLLTASNGLTAVGSDVRLGGSINTNTSIAIGGNTMTYTGTTSGGWAFDATDIDVTLDATTNDYAVNITDEFGGWGVFHNYGNLVFGGAGQGWQLTMTDDASFARFFDSRTTTIGIQYGLDYSADFTPRTLVDKQYVDDSVNGISFTFLDLTDTDADYVGHANQSVIVNGTEDGLIFQDIGAGTMSTFDIDGDSGPNQTVNDGEQVLILGGTNVSTIASATNTITVNVPSLDDADADSTNEIQVLSIDSTGATLPRTFAITLSNGGGVITFADLGDGVGMVGWDWGDGTLVTTINDSEVVRVVDGTNITTTLSGNDIAIDWAALLTDLGDVTIVAPDTNEVVLYNGTEWVNSPVPVTSTTTSIEFKYITGTASGDPGNGNFRINNSTHNLATEIYVSEVTEGGYTVSFIFNDLVIDDIILIQQKDDNTKAILVQLTGNPTDNTGWYTFAILVDDSGTGGNFGNNKKTAWTIFQDVNPPPAAQTLTYNGSGGISISGGNTITINDVIFGFNWGDGTTNTVINDGEIIQVIDGEGIDAILSGNDVGINLDVNSLVTDNSPDGAADFLLFYDVSEGAHNKVVLSSLPGGGDGIYGGSGTLPGLVEVEILEDDRLDLNVNFTVGQSDQTALRIVSAYVSDDPVINYLKGVSAQDSLLLYVDDGGNKVQSIGSPLDLQSSLIVKLKGDVSGTTIQDHITINTDGLIHPRKMTTATRDGLTPLTGHFMYNTDTDEYNYWNGTLWAVYPAAGSGMTSWVLSGDAGFNQTINDGDIVEFNGVNGILTQSVNTDILQISLNLNSLVEDSAPASTDFMVFYDVSQNAHNKIQVGDLPTGTGISNFTWGDGVSTTLIGDGETIQVIDGEGIVTSLTGNDIAVDLDVNGLVEDSSPLTTDFMVFWDVSEGIHNKIQITDLPGGGAGMTSWTVSGDFGVDQVITDGNVLEVSGLDGISTNVAVTDNLQIKLNVDGLVEDAAPLTTDFMVFWDDSEGVHNKIQVGDLPGGTGMASFDWGDGGVPTTITNGETIQVIDVVDGGILVELSGNDISVLMDIDGLTADGTPTTSTDYLIYYEATGDVHRKILFDDLPGGGATFLSLTDTPSSYSGQGSKIVAVNSGATALEFIDIAAGMSGFDWGDGTLVTTINDSETIQVTGGVGIDATLSGNDIDIDLNIASLSSLVSPTNGMSVAVNNGGTVLEVILADLVKGLGRNLDSQTSGTVDLLNLYSYSREIDMTGLSSITMVLNNPVDGGMYTFLFLNADGADLVTWPATVKFEDGTSVGNDILSQNTNKRRIVSMIYDGINFYTYYSE